MNDHLLSFFSLCYFTSPLATTCSHIAEGGTTRLTSRYRLGVWILRVGVARSCSRRERRAGIAVARAELALATGSVAVGGRDPRVGL